MSGHYKNCPSCGSADLDMEDVDIGVGTQYGPASCRLCGWSESEAADDMLTGELTGGDF